MKKTRVEAFDLGASSGRLVLGEYDGTRITLTELHRFENEPVRMNGRFYWDIFRLFHEMKTGLKKLALRRESVESIGIDTWGVDYGLLDRDGNLIGLPIHYRDRRTENAISMVGEAMPLEEIYNITGIQFMDFNTIFQLYMDKSVRPGVLEKAADLLMIPDLLGYFLSGEKYNEYTILSTSQLMNAYKKELDVDILSRLDIPKEIFCPMVKPGTVVGPLNSETVDETGLRDVKVVAVGSHDTASAVAGTPFGMADGAFLSCGTWSLLGMEMDEPKISADTLAANFTNEGGVENTIRFLKNINGLFIIQQLRKSYSERFGAVGFADIIKAAEGATDKSFRINPDDKIFTAPMDMMEAIVTHCLQTGQGEPKGLGEIAMAVYNGLATGYKVTLDRLEKLVSKKISYVHMVGGGIQDDLLCRITAQTTGKMIVTGPVEASVLGNIVMQLKALGEINSLDEGRTIIKDSFPQKIYE